MCMIKDKIMSVVFSTLLLLLCIFSIFSTYILVSIKDTVEETSETYISELRKSSLKSIKQSSTQPISILLMGVDSSHLRDASEGARSDTLIYVTVNPNTKTTNMYSISRDLYARVDDDQYDKINAAYSIGQEVQAAKAVENLLNAPVDYYMSINMDALTDTVNEIGGIDINNTLGFTISIADQEPLYTATVDPGPQHVNGDQALVYARMRYQDPEGDVGRQKRQQEVIKSVISKLKSGSILTSYNGLLDVVKSNVKTSINFNEVPNLIVNYSSALDNINSQSIVGRGEMINDIYFMIAGKHNLLNIQNQIRTDLELEQVASIKDENLLLVNDDTLELDPSTHYDFQ